MAFLPYCGRGTDDVFVFTSPLYRFPCVVYCMIIQADVHDHMEYILTSLDMIAGITENLINYTFNVSFVLLCSQLSYSNRMLC